VKAVGDEAILARIEDASNQYEVEHTNFESIASARNFSLGQLEHIRLSLKREPPPEELQIDTLAVAGSLARLEASAVSDLDMIIVTRQPSDTAKVQSIIDWRDQFCDTMAIERPNRKGVFHEPADRVSIERIAGEAGESYELSAKRALIILESNYIYNNVEYERLLANTLDSYTEDVRGDSSKNFVFLLNDTIRYFRSLCVNYQYTKSEIEYGKWPLRNIKLRHSRLLMYFSLISSIGVLSTCGTSEKVDGLRKLVSYEPLKRLFVCYKMSSDMGYSQTFVYYDKFLQYLARPEVRAELANLEYSRRYDSTNFSELKENSDRFTSALTKFFRDREKDWNSRFFEYMIL
jgi:predicted nucleotidyltransferase